MKREQPHLKLYGTAAWKKLRAMHLRIQPLCVICQAEGQTTRATVVDHVQDHKGNLALFHDAGNLQSLCKRHHDIKTCQTAGGFGNKPSNRPAKGCGLDGTPTDSRHHWNK